MLLIASDGRSPRNFFTKLKNLDVNAPHQRGGLSALQLPEPPLKPPPSRLLEAANLNFGLAPRRFKNQQQRSHAWLQLALRLLAVKWNLIKLFDKPLRFDVSSALRKNLETSQEQEW
jgi:hypothetical protein